MRLIVSAQKIDVGFAPSIAMRMNFVGELGWELHHPIEYQNHIFDKLMEAGKDLGIKILFLTHLHLMS